MLRFIKKHLTCCQDRFFSFDDSSDSESEESKDIQNNSILSKKPESKVHFEGNHPSEGEKGKSEQLEQEFKTELAYEAFVQSARGTYGKAHESAVFPHGYVGTQSVQKQYPGGIPLPNGSRNPSQLQTEGLRFGSNRNGLEPVIPRETIQSVEEFKGIRESKAQKRQFMEEESAEYPWLPGKQSMHQSNGKLVYGNGNESLAGKSSAYGYPVQGIYYKNQEEEKENASELHQPSQMQRNPMNSQIHYAQPVPSELQRSSQSRHIINDINEFDSMVSSEVFNTPLPSSYPQKTHSGQGLGHSQMGLSGNIQGPRPFKPDLSDDSLALSESKLLEPVFHQDLNQKGQSHLSKSSSYFQMEKAKDPGQNQKIYFSTLPGQQSRNNRLFISEVIQEVPEKEWTFNNLEVKINKLILLISF